MLFSTPLYGVFLLGAVAVFWLLRGRRLPRLLFLVLASYGFYVYGTYETAVKQPVPLGPLAWSLLCLLVIFLGSTLDFWIGRRLGRTESPRARKALLLVSIGYYLGVLSAFKYVNFAAESFADGARLLGLDVRPLHLHMVLPFGISFFTFETMSYTIDVYRRQIAPADRYLDYLLFVCFFPHLVMGPIVRPHYMLPQFRETPRADAAEEARGLWRIASGLVKKVVLGDYLAIAIVKGVFETPERYTSLEVLLGVYAYAAYIYCDFSGYTDIALGSAALFGYRLPENFDAPYTAKNLQDFWRRWHISLSTWLRDYLYVPLGGSRGPGWKTYRNLMITMLLGGLWHGASWTFVIWGGLHGAALAATRMWQRWRGEERVSSALGRGVAVLLTFHFVCFAWVFFRAPTLPHATQLLRCLARGGWTLEHISPRVLAYVAIGLGAQWIPCAWFERAREAFVRTPAPVQGLVLAAAAVGIHLAANAKVVPFIYGQF
jgi:alginate O-acetyltransferase complex protein AlgI